MSSQPDTLSNTPPTIDPGPTSLTPANPSEVTQAISDAWQTLQSLPWAAHAAAAAGLVLGIALCIRGRHLAKPCFALLGLLAGVAIGFFAPPLLGFDTLVGFPGPYLGAGIGALVGVGTGVALYRFAMAITGALVVGLGAFLLAGAAMGLQPPASPEAVEASPPALIAPKQIEPPQAEGRDTPASPANVAPTTPATSGPTASDHAKATFKDVADRARAFTDAWSPRIKDAWSALTSQQQGTLVVAGIGGLVAGFLLGSFMPTKSAAAFTSLAGSALSLFCLVWLTRALDAPGKDMLNRSPRSWLIIWGIVAVLGLLVQVGPSLKRRKKAPASENDAE